MTKIEQTELLVAGGGPVGLFAALCASRRGLDVVVIERNFRGAPRGHTTLLHPSSLRLLAELGLAPLLLHSGKLIEEIQVRAQAGTKRLALPFPALAITQRVFEETLLKSLRQSEVDIRSTCEVTAVEPRETQVEVGVARRERVDAPRALDDERWELLESGSIHAQFVIGADGRTSRVRRALGIGTATGPVERYAMFEFPTATSVDTELIIAGRFCHAITPLFDDRARCSFQLDPTSNQLADLPLLRASLAELVPSRAAPQEFDWGHIVDFEPTVAEAFGRGRVCLAGDAAHSTSPLGVQSMNRGLLEVYQWVEEMAACNAGKHSLTTLELLADAQRRDWLGALGSSANYESLPHAAHWLAGHENRVVSALPVSGPDVEALLHQLGFARRLAT